MRPTHKNVPDKPEVVLVVAKFQGGKCVQEHFLWLGGDRTSRLEAEGSVELRHQWAAIAETCLASAASERWLHLI